MKSGTYKQLLFLSIIGIMSFGCKKSMKEIYADLTGNNKVSAPVIAQAQPEPQEELEMEKEQDQEPATEQQTLAEEASTQSAMDAPQTATIQPPAGFKMCHQLLKSFVTEPYFYQFQANLRKLRLRGEHAQLVKAHMRHNNVRGARSKASNNVTFENCADAILGFDRYQEVRRLVHSKPSTAAKQLAMQTLAFQNSTRYFALHRCAAVISGLKEASELNALKGQLWPAPGAPVQHSAKALMSSLMEGAPLTPSVPGQKITASGCINAVAQFRNFSQVDAFKKLGAADQENYLQGRTPNITAH